MGFLLPQPILAGRTTPCGDSSSRYLDTTPEKEMTMLNEVKLIGHLGKDPDLRFTTGGTAVATFSVATSRKYKDRDGQIQEHTEWHNIVVWRNLAETCAKYLLKGKLVYISGEIQTRSYDDRDGNKRYITEIIADKVKFLGKADSSNIHTETEPPAADDEIPF
jgi:single-strand DNA-binding protein